MEENQVQHRSPRIIGGLIVIAAGVLLLLYRMGYAIPGWLFTWPMILILIGVVSLIKHQLRNLFGWIMLVIGAAFLLPKIMPEYSETMQIALPSAILVIIGIAIMFKPRRNHCNEHWKKHRLRHGRHEWWSEKKSESSENHLEETVIFSGVRKSVISKDFQGGEITTVMGGAEIDFSQADINGVVTLEVSVVLGGLKLTVPPHWEIRNKVSPVAGGVDDKRPIMPGARDPQKVLVLDGDVVFGGIDIRSY